MSFLGKSLRTFPTVTLGVALLGMSAGPVQAVPVGHQKTQKTARASDKWRETAVQYADAHWNWTTWDDSTPRAKDGQTQPYFECAEFVARALAAGGLVPGLKPDDPQDSYYHYKAPNGKEYDLLLISDVIGYRSLYDFIMDYHLGADVGDDPAKAQPGDVVVIFNSDYSDKLHTGLVAQEMKGDADSTVDAHNKAHYRRTYTKFNADGYAHVIHIDPGVIKSQKPAVQSPSDPDLIRSHASHARPS
ncbi:amidase domain-containing protein [Streptomyces herbicida]|uniref:amidase domain-containing protein n=1 Tax=Streptomyces herbicida TaxID=3065675 RepID=UPI00292DC635|nr:amidase domain-containing protein [Streptomyces sp. NEAU-HV9]